MGVKVKYARFHSPVPPAKNKEPVSEFYIESKSNQYVVDEMYYCKDVFVWSAYGEKDNIMPASGVLLARI